MLSTQGVSELFNRLRPLTQNQAKGIGNGWHDQIRVANVCQFDVGDDGRGLESDRSAYRLRDACLANAARSGQRDQPDIVTPQQVANGRDLALPADERWTCPVQMHQREGMSGPGGGARGVS